ncbi:high choriolytic enzyme 1-like isoform X4 [Pungitius pungitius]|nr:high choriolytic enzyme 1-like isoform X4 [Pungitius pungitius]
MAKLAWGLECKEYETEITAETGRIGKDAAVRMKITWEKLPECMKRFAKSSTDTSPNVRITPTASLLLLLLLGLSEPYPIVDEGSKANNQMDEDDSVDVSTRILNSNNDPNEARLEGDLPVPSTRNAMKCFSQQCLWQKASNGLVTIPFIISSEFTDAEKQIIYTALKSFHTGTCIRFVPRGNENDHISIENGVGCFSSLGRTGGRHIVSINRQGCVYHGIVQHEINHALGFNHEQNRSDRDSYVRINWENIDPPMAYNFQKQDTNNLNSPYDYSSVMHYGKKAFSNNERDTITPIPNENSQIGQRVGMSYWDITRINLLYEC